MIKLLGKLAGLLIIVGSIGIGWYWQKINTFSETPIYFVEESIDYEIKPGMSLTKVAQQLEQIGLIVSHQDFVWMVRLQGLPKTVQAGLYQINSGLSAKEILLLFAQGQVKQYAFTIVEGWTFNQLLTALAATPHLEHRMAEMSRKEKLLALGFENQHPEGQFLPDTYHFPAGTSDIEFLKRAHSALQKALEDEWSKREEDLPLKTPYQALVLASIIEKETAVSSERHTIAGVFVRRLQKNMRLQTDPTVIYGLGDDFDGNLRKKHLRDKANPYNTYRNNGLPPTPIALPGKDSINAALHPAEGDELYFVAKGDGSHYFSATIEEHTAAVRKYQIRQRNKNYRSTPVKEDQGS